MAYIALYRKWRPNTFQDLAGQEHISKTLSQAILTGKIGHAYLFSGPRGTGKTSTAKILAKALNCEKGPTPEPCGVCANCRKITDGSAMDVFEIDAASNRGIDEIRDLRETVKFAPAEGRYKVYIIDEVHMLTTEAFNALLKTLEEPPPHVVFILATTEAHKVPATIQSRCQRYDFRRITVEEIEARLGYVAKETGFEAEPEALALIALQANGGLRDALSILDQCSSLSDGKVTVRAVQEILGLIGHDWIYQMTDALAKGNTRDILVMVADLLREGKELRQMMAELSLHLRSLMIYQATGTIEDLDLYGEPPEVLKRQEKLFSQERIMGMIHDLHEAMEELKWSPQPRITVEVTLLSLCGERTAPPQPAAVSVSPMEAPPRVPPPEAKTPSRTAAAPKVTERPTAPPAPPAPQKAPVSLEAAEVWKEVMEGLRASNKTPVVACVGQATCNGMTETQFFLKFPSDMLASLAGRIYRKQVEAALERVTGKALQLVCSAEEPPAPPRKSPPAKKKPSAEEDEPRIKPDLTDLNPREKANIQHAVEILGDHFIPPPGDEAAPPEEE